METLSNINDAINGFVWGVPAIVALIGVGVFMTIRLKGIQFRKWGFIIHKTYGKVFEKTENANGDGEITSFQAAMASVSAVVGSGNIAGVATALVSGGPGALFWMLVAALVGMATKYAEICLGIMYRKKQDDGTFTGGPMYYIAEGLNLKWLGAIVSVLTIFYSIIISAVVDTNTMATAMEESFSIPPIATGIVLTVITGIVIFGGISRIGEVCGLLAPFMAGAYLLGGILVIILNITRVPEAIVQIVQYAFDPQAVFGGAAGVSVMTVMRYGFARGIYSNEAGLGTAAITHSSAKVNRPGDQALWGPLEVFVDTFIVCMITGLTIVLSGLWDSGADGVALTMRAFSKLLPGNWGQYIVLGASLLFGFSCLITFYNYLEKSCMSLFGPKSRIASRIVWLIFILVGSASTLGIVWDLADTCNGLIIFPNVIAIVLLSGKVVKEEDDYFKSEYPKYLEEKAAKKAAKAK